MDRSEFFWRDPGVYETGAYVAQASENLNASVQFTVNREKLSSGDAARGQFRFRQNKNRDGNFLFVDGHVSTLRAKLRPNGTALNGGELLRRNILHSR